MTEQDKDIFTFLNHPTDAVYAVCAETDPHVIDVADTRLKNAYEYPIGYPADKKDPKVRIRIRYQVTNDTQANSLFDNVVANTICKRCDETRISQYKCHNEIFDIKQHIKIHTYNNKYGKTQTKHV